MPRLPLAAAGLLSVLLLTTLPGCTTVAKQAFFEVRGASGKLHLNQDELAPLAFAEYNGVRFTSATTRYNNDIVDRDVLDEINTAAAELVETLADDDIYPGGSPELVVDSDVIFFERKGLLGSAQLLTHVRIHGGGQVLVDALINTRSKSFRAGDADAMAEAYIDRIGELLVEYKTPPEDEDDEHDRE